MQPGNPSENASIGHEAVKMNLPHHLVHRTIHHRLQAHGSSYTDLKDLVTDMFKDTSESQEVPMETNQLEEAMMMNSPVVKRALRIGVSPHLIKPLLRDKVLSNGSGYADVKELMAALYKPKGKLDP